jgi:hypothetical protein
VSRRNQNASGRAQPIHEVPVSKGSGQLYDQEFHKLDVCTVAHCEDATRKGPEVGRSHRNEFQWIDRRRVNGVAQCRVAEQITGEAELLRLKFFLDRVARVTNDVVSGDSGRGGEEVFDVHSSDQRYVKNFGRTVKKFITEVWAE